MQPMLSAQVYILATKCTNSFKTNKIHLKCDGRNGSCNNGFQQSVLYGFVLKKTTRGWGLLPI